MPPTTRAKTENLSAAEASAPAKAAHHAIVIPLPQIPHVAVPSIGVPHVSRPHVPAVTGRTGRALWLGGLGALALAGMIDWPVAGVVAVGAWVAEQRARAARGGGEGAEPSGAPTPD